MKTIVRILFVAPLLMFAAGLAQADKYTDTIELFKNAGASAGFFAKSYGYALIPTVGEGGFVVGGALGKGRVYLHGRYVGDTTMTQVSLGFQAGGKAYSQIIFFEDKRAFDEFTSGSFEFAASASAVAVTAGASATVGTTGASTGASAGPKNARTAGVFEKGMAVFTIAKGGLMYAVTIAGQKFSYTPPTQAK